MDNNPALLEGADQLGRAILPNDLTVRPHGKRDSTFCATIKHELSLDLDVPSSQFACMGIGKRIAAARLAQRLSQVALGKRVGAAQTTISSWEKDRTEPTRDDVQRIAAALGTSVAELELGDDSGTPQVPIVGYVGAGSVATIFSDAQGPLGHATAPRNSTDRTVAVEVRGVSLGPAFDEGLIFYDDVRSPVTEDQHNRLCVVGLPDGRVLVKILKAARDGRYHLFSNTLEEPILNEEILWAARVTDIRPR